MIKNSAKSCSFSLVHVAEIASLYIWVLKKFHGFPVSRCRIEILCIDYRAFVTLGSQCWHKEEVEKFLPFLLALSYPPFIALAWLLVCKVSAWEQTACFQHAGVSHLSWEEQEIYVFFPCKQTLFLCLSLPGWLVCPLLCSIPSEKKGLWLQEHSVPACALVCFSARVTKQPNPMWQSVSFDMLVDFVVLGRSAGIIMFCMVIYNLFLLSATLENESLQYILTGLTMWAVSWNPSRSLTLFKHK